MGNSTDVELFLSRLKQKARQFGIAYRNREKNLQGLADLEIRPMQREEFIANLTVEDFCSGPNKDEFDIDGPEYFVFGKVMPNGKTAYIKLTLGPINKQVQCWSFHVAERAMVYPLKVSLATQKEKKK